MCFICTPSVSSLYDNILVWIDSKAGNMERAETLVAAMEAEGLEATLGLYNMMMDGYAHSHNEAQCLAVFQKLKVRMESF